MKRVFPHESAADSHSLISNGIQPGALGGSRRVQTSAAMLGIALSFGTSAPLLLEPESALAAEGSGVTVLPAAENEVEAVRPKFVNTTGDLASTTYHTVEEGDSLWHIAAEHQADVTSIKAANGIEPDEVLRVGQVLRVPSVIDGMEDADHPQKVQRLALSGNVRGSVGGDLSVVFGEELPLAEEDTEPNDGLGGPSLAQLEESTAAQLESKPKAEVPYELTAAALSNTEAAENRTSSDLAEDDSPSLESETTVAALPESMPLSAVQGNPLEELRSVSSEDVQTSSRSVAEEVEELDADSVVSVAVAPTTPTSAPANSGDGWHNQDIQSAAEEAEELSTDKPLTVAALDDNRPNQSGLELNAPDQAVDTRVYRVKSGDTFWNIASRHGLSPDELMDYNSGQRPESLVVGETIVVPLPQAQVSESTSESTLASANLDQSQQARESAIRDHVARIREAANREVDQEELKARIIAVRQSLETADDGMSAAPSLEFHRSQGQSESGALPQAGASEVSSPVQSRLGEGSRSSVARSDWTVVDAASDSNGPELAALIAPAEAAPELAETVAAPSAVPENLMAVAPMGPEAYRASPQIPVGETVTPGMPMLPDSGDFLPEAPNRFNGYTWPSQGTLTSGYGWRWGRMHRGIDIAGPVGTPIMAAAPGVVVRSGWNSGGYGNLVDIRHADGSMTRYAHNSRNLVREGQQVRQGQQIAEMGSTGFSTGPHLHFEVHLPNSGTVNPLAYLPGR